MTSKFREPFEYNFHFNQELVLLFEKDLALVPEKSLKLMNHILNAHQVWNSRILNQIPFLPWQMNEFSNLNPINETNFTNTKIILQGFDLNQTILYQNTKGEKFENKIEDILFHIINHSTYHRGQIALLFRESGIEPLISDYIIYKRN
ncbi:DinB family protein [Moheibacter sediminis]|uniref:Uncharacterized damage-inducible protein DinB (Forms a four-helix bundle) n=1 Tax=Moheibacter sediminis TaxID=1434700 RepID=A0A1W2B0Z4_9FLAO|nr:DinB family protein [Moheibacter sediminis]SMC66470.1 Uncharacterized damage-inducible protein DinB (forms a four-helix bundle) [Moheibacter sediminis]